VCDRDLHCAYSYDSFSFLQQQLLPTNLQLSTQIAYLKHYLNILRQNEEAKFFAILPYYLLGGIDAGHC
jgi:hypothetical protein